MKCPPWYIRQLSKAAIAIVVINIVVSAAYATVMNTAMFIGYILNGVSTTIIVVYSFVAGVTLFSPLSGFLADVCYSRYRVILVGICLYLSAFLVYSLDAVITLIF